MMGRGVVGSGGCAGAGGGHLPSGAGAPVELPTPCSRSSAPLPSSWASSSARNRSAPRPLRPTLLPQAYLTPSAPLYSLRPTLLPQAHLTPSGLPHPSGPLYPLPRTPSSCSLYFSRAWLTHAASSCSPRLSLSSSHRATRRPRAPGAPAAWPPSCFQRALRALPGHPPAPARRNPGALPADQLHPDKGTGAGPAPGAAMGVPRVRGGTGGPLVWRGWGWARLRAAAELQGRVRGVHGAMGGAAGGGV